MKHLYKKLLIFTLALVTAMCFSNLLCRPLGTSAAEATESDSNLNMQQLAKDFEFIKSFYVKNDTLMSDAFNRIDHDFVLSNDFKKCNFVYAPNMSLPDYVPSYIGYYSFTGESSIAITVKAGVDMVEFCGYPLSLFDLSKTQYNEDGNILYVNSTGGISAENASYTYFAYLGKSEENRTVVINRSDFAEPFIFNHINTYASSTLSVSEVATRQDNGEEFYCFVPTLQKTLSRNGLVTSYHIGNDVFSTDGNGTGMFPCSSVYGEYGSNLGYYNGIYDAFFGNARKPDFEGNDRFYPSDITDKDIKKQINTAHKEAYAEFYDYVNGNKTSDTVTNYNKENLPFMDSYTGGMVDCDEFIREYLTDNTGRIYNYVDETNYMEFINGNDNYRYFTDVQQEYINMKIADANGATSKYNRFEWMYNDACDIKLARKFLEDWYGEKTYLDPYKIDDVEKVKKEYNQLPESAQEKINKMLTERNDGLEKTVDETIADYVKSTEENTGNKGGSDGDVDGGHWEKDFDDYHIDLSKWDFEDLGQKIAAFFRNPGKFLEEVGKAIAKAPLVQTSHLILKFIVAVVAVVVGFLLFKGIKAIVDLIRG